MKPLKRKTLIKLKNGRHRVASTAEARALVDVEQQRKTVRLARAARDEISNRLRASVVLGVAHALCDEDRRYAIDTICGKIADQLGPQLSDVAKHMLARDGRDMFDLTAGPAPIHPARRDLSKDTYIVISGYVPAIEWCFPSIVR